ncbi:MAG: hypothetical protein KAW90_06220, partial [Dehalococcoidales bacterium]|nr:hypothetical protein [Dehalococcoidales bacterium]
MKLDDTKTRIYNEHLYGMLEEGRTMITEDELFRLGNKEKAWNKYCGFLDLSLSDFMEIQEQLLMKQIDTVYNSPLARKFMPQKPTNVSEFRQMVSLTTYDDYAGPLG